MMDREIHVDIDALMAKSKIPELKRYSKLVFNAVCARLEHGPCGADQICKDIFYTRSSIYRRLRAEGRSFLEIKDMAVFHKALRLVIGTHRMIKQIAMDCGFTGVSGFVRYMVRKCGVPPGRLRQLHAKGYKKITLLSKTEIKDFVKE